MSLAHIVATSRRTWRCSSTKFGLCRDKELTRALSPRARRILPHRHPAYWAPWRLRQRIRKASNLNDVLRALHGDLGEWPFLTIVAAWHRLARHARNYARNVEVQNAINRLATAQAKGNLERLESKELAKLTYAWGTIRFYNKEELFRITEHLPKRIGECSPGSVTNILYGLGLLGFRAPRLLDAACLYIRRRLKIFAAWELSTSLYALALLKFRHPRMLSTVCKSIPCRFADFKAQNLSNTIYALGLLNYESDHFLREMSKHVQGRVSQFDSISVIGMIYALAIYVDEHKECLWFAGAQDQRTLHHQSRGM